MLQDADHGQHTPPHPYWSTGGHVILQLDVDIDGGVGNLVAAAGEMHVPVARDDAVHGKREGANEVVLVQILVHDFESQQSHLGEIHKHLEGLFPLGVKAYSGRRVKLMPWAVSSVCLW